MTIWFLFGLMTIGAVFAVLWPLRHGAGAERGGEDVAVYRDQLDEVERDRKAGLIGEQESEAARVEIGRRLIAAADAATPRLSAADGSSATSGSALSRRRAATIAALVLVPALALAVYGRLGSPDLPGAPFGSRGGSPLEARSMEALLAQVERHLAQAPQDGRGWEVIAPVYMRLGRFDDAVRARRNALRINGSNAEREADYGEALVAASNGVVTAEAKSALDRALAHDPRDPKARYFLGLAAEQDGKPAEAAEVWGALLAEAPAGAPWAELVSGSLARVAPGTAAAAAQPPAAQAPGAPAAAGGPSAQDVAAAAELSPQARSAMVRSMVERLSARLHQDGADVEDWVKLVRAYVVLGEPDKARTALSDARRAFAGDPEKLQRVNDAVKQFGLES